jgi:hypothetical protein
VRIDHAFDLFVVRGLEVLDGVLLQLLVADVDRLAVLVDEVPVDEVPAETDTTTTADGATTSPNG